MIITPKNWHEFQHYSKRRPPWIKVYRTLLDDAEYQMLPDASKALATMLWLLASESETAEINADSDVLAFRLRTTSKKIEDALKPLIKSGFFIVASGVLAPRYQGAIPETETETDSKNIPRALRAAPDDGADVRRATWQAYSDAYEFRHGAAPIRDAKANSAIKAFCKSVPASECAPVAAFYVQNNNSFYVSKKHPPTLLASDAAKLRTEWVTGNQITQSEAMQADKTAARRSVFVDLITEAKKHEQSIE